MAIELHVMGHCYPKTIHEAPAPAEAIRWAVKWLRDRGFEFYCQIDWHQRMNHTYVTLHPAPFGSPGGGATRSY